MNGDLGDKPYLVVGLGNPGNKYKVTRHNMGFLVVEALARRLGLELKTETRFEGAAAKKGKLHLLMPTTYMNESGRSLRKYTDYYKVPTETLIVVTDDIALNFGELRLRGKGSAGGHNGLKSVEACLGTQSYARLRIGVGAPRAGVASEDYVLQNFARTEQEALPQVIEDALDAVECWMREDLEAAMNQVNEKKQKNERKENGKRNASPL